MMFDKEKIKSILRKSPGLTGKQFARELGFIDKSDLNKFLYTNPGGVASG